MTWAPGPLVTRRRLGSELKRLRDGANLKLEDVAGQLECSPSKISRLENGKGIPKYRDVRDMLDVYRVGDGELRGRLLEWARTGQQPMWWSAYSDVLPPSVDTYVELEWDASRIEAYEVHIVHGLLQTREYARVVLTSAWSESHTRAQIERLVDVRMRRQGALQADHGLSFCAVLDESTLYRVVGSSGILRAQIEHLIGLAGADHVELRVLPFSAGLVPFSRESFAKLEFAEAIGPGLVHVERTGVASEFLFDPAEIAAHDTRMRALVEASLSEEQSIPLMERALRRIGDA